MTPARDEPMLQALAQAEQALSREEVPVGAVIVDARASRIVARAHNLTETACDPTAHAEIVAIRAAAALLRSPRLAFCDLYVTLEPCAMCAQAIAHARLRRLYFGAYDPKGGGVEHGPRLFSQAACHHRPEIIGGVREAECRRLLQRFFQDKRMKNLL